MPELAEPFEVLARRYGDLSEAADNVTRISLSAVLNGGEDVMRILAYLTGLGIVVRHLDDLLNINELLDEEELAAHPVREGVAVSIASDGLWVLYEP